MVSRAVQAREGFLVFLEDLAYLVAEEVQVYLDLREYLGSQALLVRVDCQVLGALLGLLVNLVCLVHLEDQVLRVDLVL